MVKKITIFLSMILLIGVLAAPVHASLGFIKPDSKIYFVQPTLESIRMFFLFSKEAKTDYLIELADRRTEEMDIVPSSEIAKRYTEHFEQLEKIAEKTPEGDKEQVTEKIKEASLRQQEVLARVYSKVPEQAQEAILNAQENSSKHVEKIIESAQGEEKAKEYMAQAAQIRQIEKMERQERIEQAPMEGSPQTNPSESVPKGLNPLNPLNPEQKLNPPNTIFEGENQGGGGSIMEPVAPAPMQQPAKQQ